MSSLSRNLTALSGEYFVAAYLSMNGIVASLTLKNYPGIDIFAFNPSSGKHVAIQVKTTRVAKSSGYWVPAPERVRAEGTPFVFVHLNRKTFPDFYIIAASELANLIRAESNYWYVKLKALEEHQDKWGNLGLE